MQEYEEKRMVAIQREENSKTEMIVQRMRLGFLADRCLYYKYNQVFVYYFWFTSLDCNNSIWLHLRRVGVQIHVQL